jgi:hypothetical protein
MRFTILTFLLTPVLRVLGAVLTLLLAARTPMLIRLEHRHFDTVTRLQPQALPRITNARRARRLRRIPNLHVNALCKLIDALATKVSGMQRPQLRVSELATRTR